MQNIEDTSKERKKSILDVDVNKLSAKFENPLAGVGREQLFEDVEKFCQQHNLMEHFETFKKGALLAQDPKAAEKLNDFTLEDQSAVDRELTHRWDQPFQLYWLVVMSSLAAAVQGMDETVNNGAQSFYRETLGIDRLANAEYITGLVVGAPYLCCAVLGCWLTEPLNRVLARRGTIFISCFFAAWASVWEAFTYSWPQLFAARFVLGLGIGPKSSTVPVYAAECAPAPIRGAMVMMWYASLFLVRQ